MAVADMAVIYTEVTKETDPIGGLWSAEPYALRHVEWVPRQDAGILRDALMAIAGISDWPDSDMGYVDLARDALERCGK